MDLDDESCNQILLVPAEEIRQRLSKYGASREPPQDNSVVCPSDDHFAFCARVRMIGSITVELGYINHFLLNNFY